ncbi:hypothetical protein [Sphingopyxis lindanitolerans]|uniref:hypothetical protein n=1 Tax=Sphingopyxis lindanitolerans TaxID=2054227 RepID=UPI0011B1DE7B|nr:hypothetical protein [Sphingopyxis lindanitolerans]
MVRGAIPPTPRGTITFAAGTYGTNGGHWILRGTGRSGKGRWRARLAAPALLVLGFLLLLFYLGRPIAPRTTEVDVTGTIAQSAQNATSKDR